MPTWVVGLLVLGLVAGGGYTAYSQMTTAQHQETRRRIQTATVERITLSITITANETTHILHQGLKGERKGRETNMLQEQWTFLPTPKN